MLKNLYGEKRISVYTQVELAPVLAEHGRYAAGRGGRRLVLCHCDLAGLDFANRNLSEADFSGASLVGARFYGSNLERASLYCADLRDCNLQAVNLLRADLRGASFRGAKLCHAILDGADLRAAMMMVMGDQDVSMIDRRAEGAMDGVDFSNASLKRTAFGNARLDGANFEGALLQGATFRGAKLTNASFRGAVLSGVRLEELQVPPEALEGCVLDVTPGALARAPVLKARIDAHAQWILSNGKDGRPANLDGEDLRPIRHLLAGRALAGLSARNAIAVGVDFSGCQMQASWFDGADLRDCDFSGTDLRGVSLKDTRLAHARFDKADLSPLPLSGGNSKAVDLTGALVTEGQFAEATGTPLQPAA